LSPSEAGKKSSGRNADSSDVQIGLRIRLARQAAGISQQSLADQLGLTFQQLQKYEKGINRITANRLWKIANILGHEMTWFIDGLNVAPGESIKTRISDDAIRLAVQLDRLPEDRRAFAIRIVRACLDACHAPDMTTE
jgi:transcriptional regulator with XRE-family HTH domain